MIMKIVTPISMDNYSLSMMKVIMCKFSSANWHYFNKHKNSYFYVKSQLYVLNFRT